VPYSILSIGDIVADLVFAIKSLPIDHEQHQQAHSVQIDAGGAGNFLIAGARLGMQMHALGAIGDDAFGATVTQTLAAEGVDVSGLAVQPGALTTPVLVLVDDAGKHVFVGAPHTAIPTQMPSAWSGLLAGADALFFQGYTLLEQGVAEMALELAGRARQAAIPVFFDPGPLYASVTPALRARALEHVTHVLLTHLEIDLLLPATTSIDNLRSLLQPPLETICVKRGGQGCTVLTPAATIHHPGFPVPVRDTTAAGDSFDAAFIYGVLRGWPLERVALFANAVGAAKVQKYGSGRQTPTADEVRALLRQFGVEVEF
jgi:sugar/nucleoside kinase (ribokinase family)